MIGNCVCAVIIKCETWYLHECVCFSFSERKGKNMIESVAIVNSKQKTNISQRSKYSEMIRVSDELINDFERGICVHIVYADFIV